MTLHFNAQASALHVCVNSTYGSGFCGRITGPRLNAPLFFTDINNFIVQVDALLDIQQFPQAFQRIRSFTSKEQPSVPAVLTMEEMNSHTADEALTDNGTAFLLYIFSRQNASWQGAVDWMDGSDRQLFSSTLEFMRLIVTKLGL